MTKVHLETYNGFNFTGKTYAALSVVKGHSLWLLSAPPATDEATGLLI